MENLLVVLPRYRALTTQSPLVQTSADRVRIHALKVKRFEAQNNSKGVCVRKKEEENYLCKADHWPPTFKVLLVLLVYFVVLCSLLILYSLVLNVFLMNRGVGKMKQQGEGIIKNVKCILFLSHPFFAF